MIRRSLKSLWYRISSRSPRVVLGALFLRLAPRSFVEQVYGHFLPGTQSPGFVTACIRAELNRRYYALGEVERRRLNRGTLWGGVAGKRWHDAKRDLYQDGSALQTIRAPLVSQITNFLADSGAGYHTICEIGAGHGLFLGYLASIAPQGIASFIGIDLNGDQVRENNEVYGPSGLTFIHSDVIGWVTERPLTGTCFVSCGTFECFSEPELRDFLAAVRLNGKPVAIALMEPVTMDLTSEVASRPRGDIMYSHNYPYLFTEYGFRIYRQVVRPIDPNIPFYDLVVMLACID